MKEALPHTFQVEITAHLSAEPIVESQDIIGESPTWDSGNQRLLWTDNARGLVHEAKADHLGGWTETRQWQLGRRVGTVVPRLGGGFVVTRGMEVCVVSEDGNVRVLATIDADACSFHANDGKCDSQGRLWCGMLDADANIPGREVVPGRTALYRIDPDGTVEVALEGVTVSNGLDWSPDGAIFYYIDSYLRRVDEFDFDSAAGRISNRRTVIAFEPGDGVPDGMVVDAEGGLWVAIAGKGQVRRYHPSGQLMGIVSVGTPTPTSCTFGGPRGRDLFITSSRLRLPEAAFYRLTHGISIEPGGCERQPSAGALFMCQTEVPGLPAHPFAG